jgi:hypothetical protein
MPLIAQLADMFDDATWYLIFFIGFGSPAVGCLIGCICRSGRLVRLMEAAVYYSLLGIVYAVASYMRRESLITTAAFFFLLIAGPIVGITLLPRPGDRGEE